MKHQQITVDFLSMVFTACSYLALAGAVWVFLRLVQACFWLPRHLKRQNHIELMLQDKVDNYEKYIMECEEKERIQQAMQDDVTKTDLAQTEKWKERRECLEMLKKELNGVSDGIDDPNKWDYFLEEEETEKEESIITEIQDDEVSNDRHDKINADPSTIKEKVHLEPKKDK